MSQCDECVAWLDEELHKISSELKKKSISLEYPELVDDDLLMATTVSDETNGTFPNNNSIDNGNPAPECGESLQQVHNNVDRSLLRMKRVDQAINELLRIITHRDVLLDRRVERWRNELDSKISSVNKLRETAFRQGTCITTVWDWCLTQRMNELKAEREGQILKAAQQCRNAGTQFVEKSGIQHELRFQNMANAAKLWHMRHYQLWGQLSLRVCAAFLAMPLNRKARMLELNKLSYNRYILEERRKENAMVMTAQKRERINLSSTLASLKAAYTENITQGKMYEYQKLQAAIARLNDKLTDTQMKRTQLATRSNVEIQQLISSKNARISATLERLQTVVREIAELGVDGCIGPEEILTTLPRFQEENFSAQCSNPGRKGDENVSPPIEFCIERWKHLVEEVMSSALVHRLKCLHAAANEACKA